MLNHMKNEGKEIFIYTSGRMETHNGNVGKVTKDIASITIDTLNNPTTIKLTYFMIFKKM